MKTAIPRSSSADSGDSSPRVANSERLQPTSENAGGHGRTGHTSVPPSSPTGLPPDRLLQRALRLGHRVVPETVTSAPAAQIQRKIGVEIEMREGKLLYTTDAKQSQGTVVANVTLAGQPTEVHLEQPKDLGEKKGSATAEFATGKYDQPNKAEESQLAAGLAELAGMLSSGAPNLLTTMIPSANLSPVGLEMSGGVGPNLSLPNPTGYFQINVSPTKETAIEMHNAADSFAPIYAKEGKLTVEKRRESQPRDRAVGKAAATAHEVIGYVEEAVNSKVGPMPPYLKAAIRTLCDVVSVYIGRVLEMDLLDEVEKTEKNRFPVLTRADLFEVWKIALADAAVEGWIGILQKAPTDLLMDGFNKVVPGQVAEFAALPDGKELPEQIIESIAAVLKGEQILVAPRDKADPLRLKPSILPMTETDTSFVPLNAEAPAGVKEVRDPFTGPIPKSHWKATMIAYENFLKESGVRY